MDQEQLRDMLEAAWVATKDSIYTADFKLYNVKIDLSGNNGMTVTYSIKESL